MSLYISCFHWEAREFCKEAAQIFVSGASDHCRRGKARVKIKFGYQTEEVKTPAFQWNQSKFRLKGKKGSVGDDNEP